MATEISSHQCQCCLQQGFAGSPKTSDTTYRTELDHLAWRQYFDFIGEDNTHVSGYRHDARQRHAEEICSSSHPQWVPSGRYGESDWQVGTTRHSGPGHDRCLNEERAGRIDTSLSLGDMPTHLIGPMLEKFTWIRLRENAIAVTVTRTSGADCAPCNSGRRSCRTQHHGKVFTTQPP